MQLNILIVGEDQVLSQTRALLLAEWEVATAHPIEAPQAIRSRAFDLLIFCQSVRDAFAEQLLADAVSRHPKIKCLGICDVDGRPRSFAAATYTVCLHDPGAFREAVATLLCAHSNCTG